MFKKFAKSFKYIIATTLIVLSLLGIAFYQIVDPWLRSPKSLSNFLSKSFNIPITIKHIQLDWNYLLPELKLEEVNFWDEIHQKDLIQIKKAVVRISIIKSLLHANLSIDRLDIAGATINLIHEVDERPYSHLDYLAWLTRIPHCSLEDIKLIEIPLLNSTRSTKAASFNKSLGPAIIYLSSELKTSGSQSRVEGQLTLHGSKLNFTGQWKGDLTKPKTIKAKFVLIGHKIELNDWQTLRELNKEITSVGGNFKAWIDWQDEKIQSLQGLVYFSHLTLNQNKTISGKSGREINFTPFSAHLLWEDKANKTSILTANFIDLGASVKDNSNKDLLSVLGLSGHVNLVSIREGEVNLLSSNSKLQVNNLKSLFFDQIKGFLCWKKVEGQWKVEGEKLSVRNADIEAQTKFTLIIPDDDSSAYLSLNAQLQLNRLDKLTDYFTGLSQGLDTWLKTAFHDAIPGYEPLLNANMNVIMEGQISDFPFQNSPGFFYINAALENTPLKFSSEWPKLTIDKLLLTIHPHSLNFLLEQGEILSLPLHSINGVLDWQQTDHSILKLQGRLAADLNQFMEFAKKTPLQEKFSNKLKNLQVVGPAKVDLAMNIPIEGNSNFSMQGSLDLNNAQVELKHPLINLSQLNGNIQFNEKTITGSNIKGFYKNKPFKLDTKEKSSLKGFFEYDKFKGEIKRLDEGWLIPFKSKALQGKIFFSDKKTLPWEVKLNYLNIDEDKNALKMEWKPSDIPAVNFVTQNLISNNKKLGLLEMKLRPIGNILKINDLSWKLPYLQLEGRGEWKNKQTEVIGKIAISNLKALLAKFDLPQRLIGTGSARFGLAWKGAPHDFEAVHLEGELELNLTNGAITDIGAAAAAKMGLARLLNILSLQSLGRNFKLKPNGLKKGGFEFDSIQGKLFFHEGSIYTKDLKIKGPVARIFVTGRIGIKDKNCELIVGVSPEVTASLPAIASLASGVFAPVVFMGTMLANKILNPAVDKLSTQTYHVTGTWLDPIVKRA